MANLSLLEMVERSLVFVVSAVPRRTALLAFCRIQDGEKNRIESARTLDTRILTLMPGY
jgi:hypothetical protein